MDLGSTWQDPVPACWFVASVQCRKDLICNPILVSEYPVVLSTFASDLPGSMGGRQDVDPWRLRHLF